MSFKTPTGAPPPTFTPGFHDEATVRAMPYRPLGPRGPLVSLLSFGASAIAGAQRSDLDESESLRVVVEAVRSGINVIDTAPWYGFGESERLLGAALKGVPRSAYYLHTKVCRYKPAVLEQFNFTYDRTIASVHESLARLGLDYIDVVQVHDPEFAPSLDVVLSEVLPALAHLQARGLIKRIGITGYPLDALRYLADHCPPGVAIDTALSYCHFNLHDDSLVASGTLAHLTARGIGTIMGSPLSMGLLTARGPPAWHPASPELKARCAAAAAAAAARGVDIAHLALHFALFSNPELPTILVGTASLARLAHDVEVAKGLHPLSAAEAQALAALRSEFFEGPEAERVRSWEGREVAEYWVKVGKLDRTQWTRERARFPEAIKDPEAEHNHFKKK